MNFRIKFVERERNRERRRNETAGSAIRTTGENFAITNVEIRETKNEREKRSMHRKRIYFTQAEFHCYVAHRAMGRTADVTHISNIQCIPRYDQRGNASR